MIVFLKTIILLFVLSDCGGGQTNVIKVKHSSWALRLKISNESEFYRFSNYLFEGSLISVQVRCFSSRNEQKFRITWIMQQLHCMEDMYQESKQSYLEEIGGEPFSVRNSTTEQSAVDSGDVTFAQFSTPYTQVCSGPNGQVVVIRLRDESASPYYKLWHHDSQLLKVEKINKYNQTKGYDSPYTVAKAWESGIYMFHVMIEQLGNSSFIADMTIDMHGRHGFLSAIEWPLLWFNCVFAFFYLILSTCWVMFWARSHQHSTKIHVIIGSISTAGALTHTLLFVEYASVNSTGEEVTGILWFARLLNILQITLIKLVLMIVSAGHGITRPVLPRMMTISMITMCVCKFITATSYRVLTDQTLKLEYSHPVVVKVFLWFDAWLAVLMAGCVLFMSVSTLLQLCLRRHVEGHKITLFCVFMVMCIFEFLMELLVFGMSMNWMKTCRRNWQWSWMFSSLDHISSFMLLMLLMWLWRPVDKSQSYAFTPLATVEQQSEESDEEVVMDQKRLMMGFDLVEVTHKDTDSTE